MNKSFVRYITTTVSLIALMGPAQAQVVTQEPNPAYQKCMDDCWNSGTPPSDVCRETYPDNPSMLMMCLTQVDMQIQMCEQQNCSQIPQTINCITVWAPGCPTMMPSPAPAPITYNPMPMPMPMPLPTPTPLPFPMPMPMPSPV